MSTKHLNLWLMIIAIFTTSHTHAYWKEAHKSFAEDMLKASDHISNLESSKTLDDYFANRLGFPLTKKYTYHDRESLDPLNFIYSNGNGILPGWELKTLSGVEIFYQGSDEEDLPFLRAKNHFFDPVNNENLKQTINRRFSTQELFWSEIDDGLTLLISGNAQKTPDWALEEDDNTPYSPYALPREPANNQDYSLHDSYNYLYDALTSTDLEHRNKRMGYYIYALGHVIHLLTDMGQPEHVRNDVHLTSLYEKLTDKVAKGKEPDPYFKDGSFLINHFDGTNAANYPVNRNNFKTARSYFHTTNNGTGIGLAEFTNRNFVSTTTNFDTNWYTFPAPLQSFPNDSYTLSELYTSMGKEVPGTLRNVSNEKVQFVPSQINDWQYYLPNEINYRAASSSIFKDDLDETFGECTKIHHTITLYAYPDCKKHSLNRWNYMEFRRHLAPRIIGYGASFLKHITRGTMEIRRPDNTNIGDLRIDSDTNIHQLPLLLVNTSKRTPNSTQIEALGAGKLVAVITYVDTQGEVTDVYTSDEIAISSQQDTEYQSPKFQFVKKDSSGNTITDSEGVAIPAPFPLSKPDKTPYLQVIFRGKLGVEEDVIVVERRHLYDIIKPIDVHIAPPDSGVFALVDHKAGGFTSIKAKLSSDTPLDGSIFAAAMHHNNDCYSSDLKGEYNVGGQAMVCASNKYRSTAAFSTVSAAVTASNITATPTEVGISFPDTSPLPFSATDLGLSILHYPTDGAAPIGVSFTDISEPTYISVINNTDHYAYYGDYYLVDAIPKDSNLGVFIEDRKFYPTPLNVEFKMNGAPALTITGLPAGGYSRFALLTTPPAPVVPSFIFSLEATSPNFRASLSSGLNGAISQFDSATNQIRHSYLPTIRGVISHYPIYLEQDDFGGKPDDLSLLPAIDAANQKEITLVQP